MDTYKDTIDKFFDGWEVHCNIDSFWETNCHMDSFDAFTQLLNTYPLQYVKYAEKELIEKDATGRWCARFARYVTGADVPLLQHAVIDKDATGEWCYWFARTVTGADIPLLQHAVIEKDPTGLWCYWFAHKVKGANVPLLRQTIIGKDSTGEYLAKWIKDEDSTSLPDIVEGLFNQDNPVPPILAKEYPESLELYKKLQVAQKQDGMCEPLL